MAPMTGPSKQQMLDLPNRFNPPASTTFGRYSLVAVVAKEEDGTSTLSILEMGVPARD